jgi:hypothetical protein
MGSPTAWPAAPVGEPAASQPAPKRRRRWPWVLVPVVVAGLAGAAGTVALLGDDDGDEAYCAALAERARVDLRVIVFLHPEVGAAGVARLERDIRDLPGVEDLVYVGRDEAAAEARELFADDPTMQELLGPEDVPTSFRFTLPDANAVVDLRQALGNEVWVRAIEEPVYDGRSVLEVTRFIIDEDLTGDLGRYGHWVAPDVAERLRETAPGSVADEVDVLLEELTVEEGAIDPVHARAADAIVRDARDRCGGG